MDSEKHYKISISETKILPRRVNGKTRTMPTMIIDIYGTPSLPDVLSLMKEINKTVETMKEEYISVTDMSKLNINKLLQSIILHGMESTYKTILSTKNPSKLSFVVLADNEEDKAIFSRTIGSINATMASKGADYEYKYVFIKDKKEVEEIASQILSK